jgi:hypothetical protein
MQLEKFVSPIIKDIYFPIIRFAMHASASSVGFVILVAVTVIPIYALSFAPPAIAELVDWKLLESAILYLDIFLYGVTVLLWAGVFIVEEVRAVRKLLGW